MHVINPRVVQAVQRGASSYGVVGHVGRRSGIAYQTPVDVARTSNGVLISLPYGPETDWCRNVLAADHCTLTIDGEQVTMIAPQVLLAPPAETQMPPEKLRQWQGEGIEHFLLLRYLPNVPSVTAPTSTAAL
jgi:deazaflavin-dependent oxidoreductase (nitroreductase family)